MSLAERAYTSFRDAMGNKDTHGNFLPAWGELLNQEQAAWAKAASTITAEMGRLGGARGGMARAEALTPARRSEIAYRAARKRWDGRGKTPPIG